MNPKPSLAEKNKVSPAQKSFWQAITVGDMETAKALLDYRDINVNMYDMDGEQRQGCTALHLAILEMPTWKGSEGRNGIQTEDYVRRFLKHLLDSGADIEQVCRYKGEWYLQTPQGKTKAFYPEGSDSLGLVLQFVEITQAAEVIATDVTRRLELIRDLLLTHMKTSAQSKTVCKLEYEPNLPSGMKGMFNESKYCDVILHCGAKKFQAHKVVLASRSAVFDAMFTVPCSESEQNKVEIKEVCPEVFKAFLKFLYSDKIDQVAKVYAPDLLVLANRYDVQSLKDHCRDALEGKVTVQNAVELLQLADASEAEVVKDLVLDFIRMNVDDVMATDAFKDLDSNLLNKVLKSVIQSSPLHSQALACSFPPSCSCCTRAHKRARLSNSNKDTTARSNPNSSPDNNVVE